MFPNQNFSFQTFGNEKGFPYSCFVMVRGETLSKEFTDKFSNLINLKIESYDCSSSSTADEEFVSRIELDTSTDSETEDSNGNH